MTRRFSKATLLDWAELRIREIESRHTFDPGDGTHQVEKSSPERNRAYAEWRLLNDLIDVFELGVA